MKTPAVARLCRDVPHNVYDRAPVTSGRCRGVPPLRIAKFLGERTVVVTVDGTTHRLTGAEAVALHESLADALIDRHEFVHTVGIHRPDGSYRVARRNADSAGNATVFASVERVEALFADLPEAFTAADVEATGVSAGRRHLLVRHFAEHPAIPCELVREQPLTARKTPR